MKCEVGNVNRVPIQNVEYFSLSGHPRGGAPTKNPYIEIPNNPTIKKSESSDFIKRKLLRSWGVVALIFVSVLFISVYSCAFAVKSCDWQSSLLCFGLNWCTSASTWCACASLWCIYASTWCTSASFWCIYASTGCTSAYLLCISASMWCISASKSSIYAEIFGINDKTFISCDNRFVTNDENYYNYDARNSKISIRGNNFEGKKQRAKGEKKWDSFEFWVLGWMSRSVFCIH